MLAWVMHFGGLIDALTQICLYCFCSVSSFGWWDCLATSSCLILILNNRAGGLQLAKIWHYTQETDLKLLKLLGSNLCFSSIWLTGTVRSEISCAHCLLSLIAFSLVCLECWISAASADKNLFTFIVEYFALVLLQISGCDFKLLHIHWRSL